MPLTPSSMLPLNTYAFCYDKQFSKSGIELAPLTMCLTDTEEAYIFPDLPEHTYKRLPAMLADASFLSTLRSI